MAKVPWLSRVLHALQGARFFRAAGEFPDLARTSWDHFTVHAVHAARQLADRDQCRVARRRRVFAARQRADPAAGTALPAMGPITRAAGWYSHARWRYFARGFDPAWHHRFLRRSST